MFSPMSWLWEGGEDRRAHHSRVPVGTKLGGGKGLLLDVPRDTPHCLSPLSLDMQTDNRPMGQPGQCGACSELHRSPGPKSSPFSSFIGIAHGYNLRMTWESAEPNLQNCFQTRTGQIVPSLQASPSGWAISGLPISQGGETSRLISIEVQSATESAACFLVTVANGQDSQETQSCSFWSGRLTRRSRVPES